MFVQALAAYADKNLQAELNDVAFEERAVPYYLQISADNSFLGVTPRFEQVAPANGKGKPKQRQLTHRVPRSPVERNSGEHPLLGADDIGYVLGLGEWKAEKDPGKIKKLHAAFIALIKSSADETRDEALIACCRFYSQANQVEEARKEIAKAGADGKCTVALYYNGDLLTDREPVSEWWRQHFEQKRAENTTKIATECLISGAISRVPLTHFKIKHTTSLGGQPSGVSLMSFDKDAFRSYGWKKNANSSVSEKNQAAYVLALNSLLKPGSKNRKDFDDVAFIYWLRSESPVNPGELVLQSATPANVSEVARLLNADKYADPDPNQFYLAALSVTGARLIVRSWITEKLPDVLRNVQGWWRGLEIQPRQADQPLFVPSFGGMLGVFKRKENRASSESTDEADSTKSEMSAETGKSKSKPGLATALFCRAIKGPRNPLGSSFLSELLARVRTEAPKRVDGKRISGLRTNPTAMSVLRLCINDHDQSTGEGESMPASLNEDNPSRNQAYLCGRLLAVYDRLQYLAFTIADEKVPNIIVSDRYYSMMMNSPAIALTSTSRLGISHLKKMKRCGDRGRRTANNIEQEIAGLTILIGNEPPKLFDMYDKARFVLGYYHQKFRPKQPRTTEEIDVSENETGTDSEENFEEKERD